MSFLQLLEQRRSIRKFKPEQIPKEYLDKILLAACGAPIGSNLYRDIHLTVVQDPAVLDKLAEAARYRLKDRATIQKIVASIPKHEGLSDDNYPFYHAPTVIFISHRKQTLQPGIEYSNVAGVAFAMHMEAVDLGLGSVYMWGSLEAMRIYPQYDNTGVLNLLEGFEPLLGVAIGYPEKEVEPRTLDPEKIGVNYL